MALSLPRRWVRIPQGSLRSILNIRSLSEEANTRHFQCRGAGFESRRDHYLLNQYGPLVKRLTHGTFTAKALGSNPVGITKRY